MATRKTLIRTMSPLPADLTSAPSLIPERPDLPEIFTDVRNFEEALSRGLDDMRRDMIYVGRVIAIADHSEMVNALPHGEIGPAMERVAERVGMSVSSLYEYRRVIQKINGAGLQGEPGEWIQAPAKAVKAIALAKRLDGNDLIRQEAIQAGVLSPTATVREIKAFANRADIPSDGRRRNDPVRDAVRDAGKLINALPSEASLTAGQRAILQDLRDKLNALLGD